MAKFHPMSLEAIQQEITTWDETALRRLIAYAVVLQDRKSGQSAATFAVPAVSLLGDVGAAPIAGECGGAAN